MQRIDYDAYYRWIAYQKWKEEKKRKERRKKMIGGAVVVIVLAVVVYFSYGHNQTAPRPENTTVYQLSVPSSVKVAYTPKGFEATFTVFYQSKPPVLVVTNYPYCRVDMFDKSAKIVCMFGDLKTSPDKLSLFDGVNYYYVSLDKFATANLVEQPGGGFFRYRKTVFLGDNVTVAFSLIADRLLASPKVVVVGNVKKATYKYTYSFTSDGNVLYSFTLTLAGLYSKSVKVEVTAKNLASPITSSLHFDLVRRLFEVQKNFEEPVVVMAGERRVVDFLISTNYDTTVNVVVQNNPYLTATYVASIPILRGQQNDVSISITSSQVNRTVETELVVVLSDKYNTRTFKVPVIVVPNIKLSVLGVTANLTRDGSLNMTVILKSNADFDAVIKYSSSPSSYSPSFPMSVKLKRGENKINFVVKGYPADVKTLSITLTMTFFAYGVEVSKVDLEIKVNIP